MANDRTPAGGQLEPTADQSTCTVYTTNPQNLRQLIRNELYQSTYRVVDDAIATERSADRVDGIDGTLTAEAQRQGGLLSEEKTLPRWVPTALGAIGVAFVATAVVLTSMRLGVAGGMVAVLAGAIAYFDKPVWEPKKYTTQLTLDFESAPAEVDPGSEAETVPQTPQEQLFEVTVTITPAASVPEVATEELQRNVTDLVEELREFSEIKNGQYE